MALAQMKSEAPQWVDEETIRSHALSLSKKLHDQRLKMHPPTAQKTLRKFSSGEVAKLIGVADGYLRQLSLEGKGPKQKLFQTDGGNTHFRMFSPFAPTSMRLESPAGSTLSIGPHPNICR